jgi:hypothetical protein
MKFSYITVSALLCALTVALPAPQSIETGGRGGYNRAIEASSDGRGGYNVIPSSPLESSQLQDAAPGSALVTRQSDLEQTKPEIGQADITKILLGLTNRCSTGGCSADWECVQRNPEYCQNSRCMGGYCN